MVAVGRNLEKLAAHVGGQADPARGPWNAEVALSQGVDFVNFLHVELAIRAGKPLQELRAVLAYCEIDVALAYWHDLRKPLRAHSDRGVEEQGVDVPGLEGVHRAGARRDLDELGIETRVAEVALAVLVLALRHRRIADAHPRPVGDLG